MYKSTFNNIVYRVKSENYNSRFKKNLVKRLSIKDID